MKRNKNKIYEAAKDYSFCTTNRAIIGTSPSKVKK
jgi:hypothetical protein